MRLILLIFLFCIVGCGRIPDDIDPYFSDMIAQYHQDAQSKSVGDGDEENVKVIMFYKIDSAEEGLCAYHVDDSNPFNKKYYKEMLFNEDIKKYSKSYRYKVFLHEVGHCMYHLSHDNSEPHNIMYYISNPTWNDKVFEQEKNYFFQAAKNNQDHWGDTDSPA